jgi:FkbM family methyltransferase
MLYGGARMSKSLNQLLRPLVPNIRLRISHAEPGVALQVRLRQHLGLVTRGAKAYESAYVEALRGCVRSGDTVFDVGANIGFYSVLFSRWVGPGGKVICFEPDPDNVLLLRRNLELNNCENALVREVAMGRTQEVSVFSRDPTTGATGHLGKGPTYGETVFGAGKEFLMPVKTETLDAEAQALEPPDVIKLDIEGGEYEVLCGGSRVLREERPLVISELSAWADDGAYGKTRAELAIELFQDLNYLILDLDTGKEVPHDGERAWMVMCIPRERLEEERFAKFALKMKESLAGR